MKKLFLLLFCFVFLTFFYAPVQVQAQQNQVDIKNIRETLPKMLGANNAGKEFWLSVPPCFEDESGGNANFVKIYITSPVKTLVRVEVPNKGYLKTQYTVPNDVILFDITPAQAQCYVVDGRTPEIPDAVFPGDGIHITADQPLVVYLVVRYTATSDGLLAFPVSSLGKEYIVAGHQVDPMFVAVWNYKLPCVTTIVGTQDQTRVSFTLGGNVQSKTAGGLTPGQSASVVLNAGDVWAISTQGAYSDLTGSKIVATKPVAVVTGNKCNNIPDGNQWCDYTVEMDMPTFTWGLDYHVAIVPGRKFPPIIRVFSKEGNTDVFRDGNQVSHIKEAGGTKGRGWQEFRLVPMEWKPQSSVISGNKPINVVLYNPGVQEDGYPLPNSDPFVMGMTPYQQYQKEITFATPGIRGGQNFSENYVNFVYQADENGSMPTDCQFAEVKNGRFVWEEVRSKFPGVDEEFAYKVDGKRYKVKTITLKDDGVYKLKSEKPFAAYSFGYGWCDSYGYPTSAALADLEKPDTVCPQPIWKMTCDGVIEGATVTDKPDDPSVRSNLSMIVFYSDSSYNFEFSYNDFVPGETVTTSWRAEVRDKTKDARAVISFMDRRGNDTTIVIEYHAVSLAIRPEKYDFGMLKIGETKEATFWAINKTKHQDVIIDKFQLKFANANFEILDLAPRFLIPKNDSLKFRVRFTAKEEGEFQDSILMEDTCYNTASAFVKAAVGEPIIWVTDIAFGDLTIGTTLTKDANIRNTGSVDLTITGYSGPTESVYIPQLAGISEQNPLIIKPNAPPWVFNVSFTPTEERQYPDAIIFSSDAVREDSICVLSGRGIKAELVATSLEWPRLRINRPAFPKGPYSHPDLGIILTNHGSQEVNVTGLKLQKGNINDPAFIFDRSALLGVIAPGGSKTVNVQFNPEAVGPHELVFQYQNSANSETETRLYGEGILPKVSTTDYDFGQTVVFDYTTPPNHKVIRISCDNWEWEDSVTIESFDIIPAGGIKTSGIVNNDQNDYGTEGYVYDESQINFPVVIQPGQYIEFDAYFIAKKVEEAKVSITTKSDAEQEKTSNWRGTGISLGLETKGSETFICYGENAILTLEVKNTALGVLSVDHIGFDGDQPDEITVFPADQVLFDNGFNLQPNESQIIRFNYSPLTEPVGIAETVANLIIYNNTLNEPEKHEVLKGSVVHFNRESEVVINNHNPLIKKEVVPVSIRLKAGEDITKANVDIIDVVIKHTERILQIKDGSMMPNTQYFDIIRYNPNKLAGTINVTLKVKPGQSANLMGKALELLHFELNTYLPTSSDKSDRSPISATIVATGNACVTIAPSADSLELKGECVYDLRWIEGTGNQYALKAVKPNPVGGSKAELEFSVALDGQTNIAIYNSLGEMVSELINGNMKAGNYVVDLPVSTLSSGVYLIKMQSGPFAESTQMVIAK